MSHVKKNTDVCDEKATVLFRSMMIKAKKVVWLTSVARKGDFSEVMSDHPLSS